MSQFSFFGRQKSQIGMITNRKIFESLKESDPVIYPSNEQYGYHVRNIVLKEMKIEEDHLSSSQYLGLRTDVNNFVDKNKA